MINFQTFYFYRTHVTVLSPIDSSIRLIKRFHLCLDAFSSNQSKLSKDINSELDKLNRSCLILNPRIFLTVFRKLIGISRIHKERKRKLFWVHYFHAPITWVNFHFVVDVVSLGLVIFNTFTIAKATYGQQQDFYKLDFIICNCRKIITCSKLI